MPTPARPRSLPQRGRGDGAGHGQQAARAPQGNQGEHCRKLCFTRYFTPRTALRCCQPGCRERPPPPPPPPRGRALRGARLPPQKKSRGASPHPCSHACRRRKPRRRPRRRNRSSAGCLSLPGAIPSSSCAPPRSIVDARARAWLQPWSQPFPPRAVPPPLHCRRAGAGLAATQRTAAERGLAAAEVPLVSAPASCSRPGPASAMVSHTAAAPSQPEQRG
jgi:hypothetical protein